MSEPLNLLNQDGSLANWCAGGRFLSSGFADELGLLGKGPQREHFVFSIVRGVQQGLKIFDSRWFMVVANGSLEPDRTKVDGLSLGVLADTACK